MVKDEPEAVPTAAGEQEEPSTTEEPWRPKVHEVVKDTYMDVLGVFEGEEWGRAYLRPQGGGLEWTTHMDNLAPVTTHERIKDQLDAVNARSRGL
ncbi:hypothetical protein ABZ916_25910 [Streptomyces sp. NPDC046853]|uniref:hypothetical protein n=1 Tax=Streptomyces sp. NPDC046853 TaxID=3154920 RepID=UPI00340C8141